MSSSTHVHICPFCFSGEIERVPRHHVLDRMALLLGWRVYRCVECGSRFYDRPIPRQQAS
jgi:hypothetical protein